MKRTSEKKHWNAFWSASRNLDDVYGTDQRILENLRKYVTSPGARVLEVGAGTGRDADALAGEGALACALDYSEESLALMRASLRHPVDVVCGDARMLPFIAGSFDAVYHQGLLEHFTNPGALIDENVRVLKPGGILLVDVPQRYHYYTLLKHILIRLGKWFAGWETEFSVRELRSLLESFDLDVVGVYGHNLCPPIWYRGMRRILLRAGVRIPMFPRGPRFLTSVWRFARSLVPPALFVNTAMVVGCVARKRGGRSVG